MYEELVKRLRNCATEAAPCKTCDMTEDGSCTDTLMKQAADAIEEQQRQIDAWVEPERKALIKSLPKWIPVTERLPEEEESVFVVRKFLGVKGQVPPSTYTEIAYRIGDRWVADSDEYKIARHRHTDPLYWMPLPEPPKEE